MFMLGYEIAFWCCLVWQGGWNLNKNISVCRKCLLQQGKWWVGVKYEEQEDNLDGNSHGPDLDSVYCSMVFLGSEHLPLTVAALVHRPFIWRCPIPPAEPAYLGWNLRIIPKLGFCLVPSLGLRREKSLGFFAFLTSYKFCGSSLGVNCPVSQVETPQQLWEHPSTFAGSYFIVSVSSQFTAPLSVCHRICHCCCIIPQEVPPVMISKMII